MDGGSVDVAGAFTCLTGESKMSIASQQITLSADCILTGVQLLS
jgi:hypothetical protein